LSIYKTDRKLRSSKNSKKELYRATMLEPTNVPGDVVTMNSIVQARNIDAGEERAFLPAVPRKTGSQGRAVSILSPMGIALPGYREEDALEWSLSSGNIEIRVMEIIYQPGKTRQLQVVIGGVK